VVELGLKADLESLGRMPSGTSAEIRAVLETARGLALRVKAGEGDEKDAAFLASVLEALVMVDPAAIEAREKAGSLPNHDLIRQKLDRYLKGEGWQS